MPTNNSINILLIEDEESLVLLYTTLFKKDFNIVSVGTKEDAEKKIKQGNIDLILLDIIIPHNDKDIIDYSRRIGFELLDEIKKEEATKNIKVIVLTNLESQEDRKKAMRLGADEYIVKSDTIPKNILAISKKVLEKK